MKSSKQSPLSSSPLSRINFDRPAPTRIPESQGDQADQAQEQIEMSLLEQIRRARQGLPPALRQHRPDYDSF